MDFSLVLALSATLVAAIFWFPFLIRIATQKNLVDVPTSRRRHKKSTPIVGGVGIFVMWFLGIALYSVLHPTWFQEHSVSLLMISISILGLLTIGLIDDLRGLSPQMKLLGEFSLAILVLLFEPVTHANCRMLAEAVPSFLQPLVWALTAVWIVGAANAVNLVDGIDGFAGGVSTLAVITTLFLHVFSGFQSSFMPVVLLFCLPGLVSFLVHNWHPAKIFLGDNGSLTLGFLIAVGALIPSTPEHAFTTVGSLFILLAYPLLDMSLCVRRRYMSGYPIFKADRSHLHHRVQRLGLSVPQTTTLLLCAVSYFQLSALVVHLVHYRLAILVGVSAVIGLFTILYLIRCLESWQRSELLGYMVQDRRDLDPTRIEGKTFYSYIDIDLKPLLEVGLWEERVRARELVHGLIETVQSSIRPGDELVISNQNLKVFLYGGEHTWNNRDVVKNRLYQRLMQFQSNFQLQYSLDGLPLEAKKTKLVA